MMKCVGIFFLLLLSFLVFETVLYTALTNLELVDQTGLELTEIHLSLLHRC